MAYNPYNLTNAGNGINMFGGAADWTQPASMNMANPIQQATQSLTSDNVNGNSLPLTSATPPVAPPPAASATTAPATQTVAAPVAAPPTTSATVAPNTATTPAPAAGSGQDINGMSYADYSKPLGSSGLSLLDLWNYYPVMSGYSLDQMKQYAPQELRGVETKGIAGLTPSSASSSQIAGASNFATPFRAPTPGVDPSVSAQASQAQQIFNAGEARVPGQRLPGGGIAGTGGQGSAALDLLQRAQQAAGTPQYDALLQQLQNLPVSAYLR